MIADGLAAGWRAAGAAVRLEAVAASTYRIGRSAVRIDVGDVRLGEMIASPMRHLATQDAAPDLRLRIWSGGDCSWLPRELLEHEDLLRFRGFLKGGERYVIIDRQQDSKIPELVSLMDRTTGRALHWVRDPVWARYHLAKTPIHDLLRWWQEPDDTYLLHAGAVGGPDGGLLLAGASRSGKTTIALSCLGSGLQYAGDDVCLVAVGTAPPHVYSLYCSAAVNHEDLATYPELGPLQQNSDRPDEKPLLSLFPTWRDHFITDFPLRAIVLPQIADTARSTLAPVSAGAALFALGPTTLLQFRGSGAKELRGLAALARAVPAYRLSLGHDRHRLPGLLGELL